MARMHGWLFTGFLAIAGFVFAGCDSAPKPATPPVEHDHDDHGHEGHGHDEESGAHAHEHPETYAAAVEELSELNEKIRGSFAKDDKEAADPPVHEFGHVLEEVVELAEKAEIGGEDLEAIKKAVDQLFDDVGKVDTHIHEGEGKGATYAEVEQQVDEALATLKKYVPAE